MVYKDACLSENVRKSLLSTPIARILAFHPREPRILAFDHSIATSPWRSLCSRQLASPMSTRESTVHIVPSSP